MAGDLNPSEEGEDMSEGENEEGRWNAFQEVLNSERDSVEHSERQTDLAQHPRRGRDGSRPSYWLSKSLGVTPT